MKVSHKREETLEERVKRFKADPYLAKLNRRISVTDELANDLQASAENAKAERDKYISENYPDLLKSVRGLLTGS